MSDYTVITKSVPALREKLELPKFQRGYVWNEAKKVELIDSLHNGYPFGALLTYQKKDSDKEELLDGQQRWSTILDYVKENAKYWKALNIDEYTNSLAVLNSWILPESPNKISSDEYSKVLSGPDDIVADWVDEQMSKLKFQNGKSAKDIRDIIKNNKKSINDYLDVNKLEIPVIRYTGDESNIANVFENLNKGGVQLSKFEIFAAAWNNTSLTLTDSANQNEILNNVKNYYIDKQTRAEEYEFILTGFSEDELTRSKKINLFDLGVAIGKFTQKRLSSLITDTEKSKNEIGFGLLGLAADVDPKHLGTIGSQEKTNLIAHDLEKILFKIDKISNQLQNIFGKLLAQHTRPDNSENTFQNGLNTTYKTLSYFAALWDSNDEKETLKVLPSHYVYDSIYKVWGNAGDSRFYDFYPSKHNKTYTSLVAKEQFIDQFKLWLHDTNTQTERFSVEVKALSTIHANLTYLSAYFSFNEPLQFEHIYPKARVRHYDTDRKVLLGNLGNCMYLPQKLNNKKKINTLYEEYDNSSKLSKLLKASRYPTESNFDTAFNDLSTDNFDTINNLIISRANGVIDDIVKSLTEDQFHPAN